MNTRDIAALPAHYAGRPATLGEFFAVTGERSSRVRVAGDLEHADGIGTAMSAGEIVVEGSAGPNLGTVMTGGSIDVHGNTGANAGGPQPGGSRGMSGGEIVIRGNAGDEVGAAVRRGLVVVMGNAGRGTGRGMIAGTVLVAGGAGPGAGRFLKRGSIIAFRPLERPGTFVYACTYRPPFVPLLFRYLRNRYGLKIGDAQMHGRYRRFSGDLAELGKGEILEWAEAIQ
jgi:formylmethanofuran dehydrogenase subunit C